MHFYYFKVANDYAKQSFLEQLFHTKLSKNFIRKKFIQPLKTSNLLLFHFHEIATRLFHIVVLINNESEVLNCFYDAKQQLFFFEQNKMLQDAIQNSLLWSNLAPIETPSDEYHLYTAQELSKIIQ